MDKTTFNYKKLDLPNVQQEYFIALTSPPSLHVPSEWHTLIYTLAKKRPNWAVVIPYGRSAATYIRVEEAGEVLGTVKRVSVGSGFKFEVKAARRPFNRTQDPQKAINLVLKHFARQTLAEVLREASSDAQSKAYTAVNGACALASFSKTAVVNNLDQYFMDNWSAVEAAALSNNPTEPDAIRAYPERRDKAQAARKIIDRLASGHVVVIRDGTYNVCSTNGNLEAAYIDTTLPPYYKKAVGMLKLVDPNEMVAGYGVRVSDTVFYVCEEE